MEGMSARFQVRPPDDVAAAFAALVRLRDEDLPLDRAAALLARGLAYPDLDVAEVLAQLDDLAGGLTVHLPVRRDPAALVEALRRYLGEELGFRGPDSRREDAYDDPRNSFLNDVLGRRIGLPITLSIVYLEVARRAGIPLVGVGMPLHFVVKYPLGEAPGEGIFLDPFLRGAILTPQDLRDRFAGQYRGRVPFEEHYLGAVTKKQLLTRVLLNLRQLALRRNDPRRVLAALDYQLLIAPWDLEARRDRGLVALRLGEAALALDDLQTYERHATGDPNLPVIRSYIEALRRRFSLGA